jgi:hypothetical protein
MRHDIDLISMAADYSVMGQEVANSLNLQGLEQDGQSSRIVIARMVTMQTTIIAIGTISVFESFLQQTVGWDPPFTTLDRHLRDHGLNDLAERFLDYRDAINVLKHGSGRSHDRLLRRRDRLNFGVRALDNPFHDEGDISEISTLVRADAPFVRNCGRLIAEVVDTIRRTVPSAPL